MSTYKMHGYNSGPTSAAIHSTNMQYSLVRKAGDIAFKQSGMEELEPVDTTKKAKRYADASGVSQIYYSQMASNSQKELESVAMSTKEYYEQMNKFGQDAGFGNLGDKSYEELETFLSTQKDLSDDQVAQIKELMTIKSSEQTNVSELMGILEKSGITSHKLKVDVTNVQSINSLFVHIDNYAMNHNMPSLSRMKSREIFNLAEGMDETSEAYKVVYEAALLKKHSENLTSMKKGFGKQKHSVIRLARKTFQDVDGIDSGLMMYETVDSVRNTIKLTKRLAEKLKRKSESAAAKSAVEKVTKTAANAGAKAGFSKAAAAGGAKAAAASGTAGATATAGGAAATAGATATAGAAATGATAATATGTAVAGGTAAAGAGTGGMAFVVIAIVAVVLLLVMAITNAILSIVSIFDSRGESEQPPLESHPIEITLEEKDAGFAHLINNHKNSVSVSKKGYWDFNSNSQRTIYNWDNSTVKYQNGSGAPISANHSNDSDIVAAVFVFAMNGVTDLTNTELIYVEQMWDDTHRCSHTTSAVYPCDDGCNTYSYRCNDESFYKNVNKAHVCGSVVPYSVQGCVESGCPGHTVKYCTGHFDLTIIATTLFANDAGNVFFLADTTGAKTGTNLSIATDEYYNWEGWTEENMEFVRKFSTSGGGSNDTPPPGDSGLVLTEEEINSILAKLPQGTSSERIAVVKFALQSVGRIPYYWPDPYWANGVAIGPGYAGNNFGTVVEADPKGRNLKGLDCSHWVDWVFWSMTGDNLGNGSTATLKNKGKGISRSALQPGDVVVDDPNNAHTAIFLYWDDNGNMVYVHENASANNVSISSVPNKYWDFYRSILD